MKKPKEILESIDSKVDLKTGKSIHKWVKVTNYIWMLIVLPIVILTFGATLNINTTVSEELGKIQTVKTQVGKDVEVAAGSQVTIANVNLKFEDPTLATTNKTDTTLSVGTSEETEVQKDITSAFDITDSNELEIVTDAAEGKELSIYSSAVIKGIGIDYTNYSIIVDNQTDVTYKLNINSIAGTPFFDLSDVESATYNITTIDESWIHSEVTLAVVLSVISIWAVIWAGLSITQWYFGKWKFYDDGGEENGK